MDENEKPTKEAVGMYSKDGEYVDFDKPCQCVGQVWLLYKCRYVHGHPDTVYLVVVQENTIYG